MNDRTSLLAVRDHTFNIRNRGDMKARRKVRGRQVKLGTLTVRVSGETWDKAMSALAHELDIMERGLPDVVAVTLLISVSHRLAHFDTYPDVAQRKSDPPAFLRSTRPEDWELWAEGSLWGAK